MGMGGMTSTLVLRASVMLSALALLSGCAADSASSPAVPTVESVRVAPFHPRQTLLIEAAADQADSVVATVFAPQDTERVVLRPYPAICRDGCAAVGYMVDDGGSAGATSLYVDTLRWAASLVTPLMDVRRGVLLTPTRFGGELADTMLLRTRYGFAQFGGARTATTVPLRFATLATTDAFDAGRAPVPMPVRGFDHVLHARTGDRVEVRVAGAAPVIVVVASAPDEGRPSATSSGSVSVPDSVVTLRLRDEQFLLDLPVSYTNRGPSTVLRDRWCLPILERWTRVGWRTGFSNVCALLPVRPDTLRAGATLTEVFTVRAAFRPRTAPTFAVDPIEGWYRVRVRFTRLNGEELPVADQVSAPFRIRPPQ
jgi:hypothetical protein